VSRHLVYFNTLCYKDYPFQFIQENKEVAVRYGWWCWLVLAVGFGLSRSAPGFQGVELAVSDSPDRPYQWEEASCTFGQSDLVIRLPGEPGGPDVLTLRVLRIHGILNELPATGARPVAELRLAFHDRGDWIYDPRHFHSFCDLRIARPRAGELAISGGCHRLRPRAGGHFTTGFEIPADTAIVCRVPESPAG
jgi:hypothetical protein